MTAEFAKIVNRLARARNFEDGSFLLITSEPNSETFMIEMKGSYSLITEGCIKTLEKVLSDIDNEDALRVREAIKKIIIEDEARRFQQKGISE